MKRVHVALAAGLLLAATGTSAVVGAWGAAAASPRLSEPVTRTLSNGLRVVVFARPGLPVVQVQLQTAAGVAAEPAGHSGVAFLTAQLLRQGTTSRSALDFSTELDTLGATFAINVTRDVAQIAGGCRLAEFESVMELMSDAVVNPLFGEEAFQATRKQVANQLGAQAQNVAAIADERAAREAFGGHPYARELRGNIASLLGATREQVSAFHRDRWRPDRAVLAIAGDIDPERAFAAAADWFGRWSGKSAPEVARAAPSSRRGVLLLDLVGSPNSELRAVLVGPGRADPDHAGWVLAREALADAGLPPPARVTLQSSREACLLVVSASARPESTAAVAARIQAGLGAFAASPPSGAALDVVRRRAAQGWALSLESLGQLLATWLSGDAAGLPAGQLAATPRSYRTANLTGVASALRAGVTLLIAGPADRLRSLASLGEVHKLSAETEPGLGNPALTVTPEQRKAGRRLLAAAVAAHGGEARLKAVVSSEMSGDLQIDVGGRPLGGEVRFLRVDPAQLAYTTRMLDLEHRQVLDGGRGWSLSMVGDSASLEPADSTQLMSLRSVFASDLVHLLRVASDTTGDPVARGPVELDGKPMDGVEFVSSIGVRTRLLLDRSTHRVSAVEAMPTPQGAWRDRRRWSDYAQIEGVWWPRHEVREIDGDPVSTMILRKLVVNGTVDTMLFHRPIVARGRIRGVE